MDATPALVSLVTGIALLLAPQHGWQGSSRWTSLIAGALFWAASDSLWSQIGPARRFYVGYELSTLLPATLAYCALMLVLLYHSAVEFLDKPPFDPFERGQ